MMDDPNQSRYRMLWGGQWRPVTWMGDREGRDTKNHLAAVRAVLYISRDEWVATLVTPGEIVTREGAVDNDDRQWEIVD